MGEKKPDLCASDGALSTKKKDRRVKLVVFMEPGKEDEFEERGFFCCRREPYADGMEKFSKKTKQLPYSCKFVSIAVLRADEDICDSAASIYGNADESWII